MDLIQEAIRSLPFNGNIVRPCGSYAPILLIVEPHSVTLMVGVVQMRIALLVSVMLALAGAASAASIGGPPDLDRLVGVYKHRAAPGFDQNLRNPGEDILEIVKLSDHTAYLRIHTADGEHICGLHGVADVTPEALVYSRRGDDGPPCTLKLRSTRDGVVLDDVGGSCSRWNCGVGADLGAGDRVNFKFSERRQIRYLPRILSSREYAEAVKEHDQRQISGISQRLR